MKYEQAIDWNSNNTMTIISEEIQPNSKVLEFGPASGRLTKYLKEEKNCEVYIVEIDSESGNIAKEYAVKSLVGEVDGNIESLKWAHLFAGETFDYIIFADVLEHLRNPLEILEKSKEFLNKDGYIMFSVPNIAHNSVIIDLMKNRFNYSETGILDNTHLKFWTFESIEKLVKNAGLNVDFRKATYSQVGMNEFDNSYAECEKEIEFFLKTRDYPEVYQFIYKVSEFASCADQNFLEKKTDYYYVQWIDEIQGELDIDKRECIQVDFTSEMCIVKHHVGQNVSRVRFDPINLTNCCVKNISVYGMSGEEKFKLSFETNAAYVNGEIFYFKQDPNIFINVEDEINEIEIQYQYVSVNSSRFDELINMINDAQKEMQDIIGLKENYICEQRDVIEQKENYICEQRGVIEQKENYICEQRGVIEQKENYICEQRGVIEQKENYICEQRGIIEQKDNYINEQRGVIMEKDHCIEEQKELMKEQQNIIQQKENYICEQRDMIHQKDEYILELHRQIVSLDEMILHRGRVINDMSNAIHHMSKFEQFVKLPIISFVYRVINKLKRIKNAKKKKMLKIGILNPYVPTLGGGEKHMGYLCQFLERYYKDVEIDIIVHNYNDIDVFSPSYITIDNVNKQFGLELTKTKIRKLDLKNPTIATEVIEQRELIENISAEYDVFVNFMFLSKACGKARINIYECMFPPQRIHPMIRGFEPYISMENAHDEAFVNSYDLFITNSEYTDYWANERWGTQDKQEVIYPPVFFLDEIEGKYVEEKKKNIIISVGRFFVGAHSKKQLDLVKFFVNHQDVFKDYEYHLVGAVATYGEDVEYLNEIKAVASTVSNVFIHENCAFDKLMDLYTQAKIFWHATGYGVDETKEPEKMEHFGITPVEAMSYGAVPVVINKGGPKETVDDGINGFCWDTEAECVEKTRRLIESDELRKEMAIKSAEKAKDYSIEMFYERHRKVFEKLNV